MVPGTQTRALSLRSTSVHMLSSNSSFSEFSNCRICSASPIASTPRAMVPEIGQVSTRRPSRAHEHFRRGRHQEFAVAEIHQRAIGRRVDPAQPLEHFRRRALAGLGEQLPRHRLEQIAARERRARGLDRGLVFAGRVIGKALPRRFGVDAFRGLARQAFGRFAVPGKIIAQHHAAPGGAVIGQQAIRHIQHDVALVAFARALLHEVLDLEHQIIGERAEQAEQRIVIGASAATRSRTSDITLARRVRWSSSIGASPRTIWPASRLALLSEMTMQGSRKRIAEKRDQHLAARVQRGERKIVARGFQHQRRIGEAEIKTLIAARHRGARRQHHAAAAVEQVDQIVEPVGAAGELLHRARHHKAAAGAVFAVGAAVKRLSCSCDPLTRLAEGTPHRTNEKAVALR